MAFFFSLRLTSAPASPTMPIPSRAMVVGSGTGSGSVSILVDRIDVGTMPPPGMFENVFTGPPGILVYHSIAPLKPALMFQ